VNRIMIVSFGTDCRQDAPSPGMRRETPNSSIGMRKSLNTRNARYEAGTLLAIVAKHSGVCSTGHALEGSQNAHGRQPLGHIDKLETVTNADRCFPRLKMAIRRNIVIPSRAS
jgi:hypothetical protein